MINTLINVIITVTSPDSKGIWCTIKIFREKDDRSSRPIPSILRGFWKDSLMTPTTPLQASFTVTPSSLPHPPVLLPHENFDRTHVDLIWELF